MGCRMTAYRGSRIKSGIRLHRQPAGHAGVFLFIEGLNGLVLLLGVIGVFRLKLLYTGSQAGHFHGTFLGFCADGEQDQLHDDGEQNQRHAVVAGQVIEPAHQVAEGHGDDVGQVECKHCSSSLGHGVEIVSLIERVAPQQSPQGQIPALESPVFLNGGIGVCRAGRSEPAARRRVGGNAFLIEPDQQQKEPFQRSASDKIPAFFARFR